MRLVLLADTHTHKPTVPDGDVLVFAGDMCLPGELSEVFRFAYWLTSLPHKHKLVIAGNHDFPFERPAEAATARGYIEEAGATYLEDAGVEIDGVKFWGSPWQPWFFNWAFNLQRGPEIRAKWELIPRGTDVLITHGPPVGFGDWNGRENVGCADLKDAVFTIAPRLHVFGHIHESYGTSYLNGTTLVNASVCDARYRLTNPAIEFEFKRD